jgi:hypothetical protein
LLPPRQPLEPVSDIGRDAYRGIQRDAASVLPPVHLVVPFRLLMEALRRRGVSDKVLDEAARDLERVCNGDCVLSFQEKSALTFCRFKQYSVTNF